MICDQQNTSQVQLINNVCSRIIILITFIPWTLISYTLSVHIVSVLTNISLLITHNRSSFVYHFGCVEAHRYLAHCHHSLLYMGNFQMTFAFIEHSTIYGKMFAVSVVLASLAITIVDKAFTIYKITNIFSH